VAADAGLIRHVAAARTRIGRMTVRCQRTTLSARSIGRNAVDFWQDTSGAVALEYGLIAALIAVAIIGTLVQLSESLVGLPLQSLIDAFIAATS
jgi:Flp pilus assembly pilin Flp